MSPYPEPLRQVRFAEFHLDLNTAELRNNGNKCILQGQPLQVLVVLLERPGQLVSREELKKKLWPGDTFVDFDQSLNKAVNRLREALNDSAEHPRFIQTLPRRGYRFIASVEALNQSLAEGQDPSRSAQHAESTPTKADRLPQSWRSGQALSRKIVPVAIAFLLLVLGIAGWFRRPLPVPRVVGSIRITNDGWRKFALVTDGVRLYFSERGTIAQSSTEGGEITEISTGLTDVDIYDISPRRSELLVADGVQGSEIAERPIWIVTLPAGTPSRVGDIRALWACWAPDGVHLAYATKNALYLAKKDGTEIRKLANIPEVPWKLQFSPDGSRLRFDAYDAVRNVDSIWEMTMDGNSIRSLFPGWNKPLHTGIWNGDGKYFFFNTHDPVKDRDEDVWVLPESARLQAVGNAPVQLTKGPLAFGSPVPSPDGSRLFVLGTQSRAELVRYDAPSKQFVPFLAGISASEAEVSHDGEWVAYVSYPDLTLWRSRLNGTQRLQLTFPPMEVVIPRWSPDGAHIAFTDVQPGKAWKIYNIAAAGGTPERVIPEDTLPEIDPTWWPDGSSIVFGRSRFGGRAGILRVDLTTHLVSSLPKSEALFGPRVSPDGHYVAAFPGDATRLMLYDFRASEWREAARGTFQFSSWSRDGKNVYMLDKSGGNELVRFNVDGWKLERLLSLKDVVRGSKEWIGLSADDSPILVLDKGVTDVYRLDLQIP
jgi:DNA-binding winged helix-turn-helix (wHTH) protein/Tol biopolymer transport system component